MACEGIRDKIADLRGQARDIRAVPGSELAEIDQLTAIHRP
jgi:hypothetical protein